MNLKPLSLSTIEEKIFTIILHNPDTVAKNIVELCNHDKKVIYENIEKLQRKGLITSIVKGRTRHYSFAGTKQITAILKENERTLQERKKQAEELIEEINKLNTEKNYQTETELYLGKQNIRQFFQSILNEQKNYSVIGVPLESEQILGKTFWENFHLKQKELKIKAKMIFNPSLKYWKVTNPNLQVKYFDVEPITETIIFEDKIAIIIWSQDPSVTIINNELVAKSYQSFFNMMWKTAKE
jgi:sugar-specific transcriptional regulator TrmB